MSYRRDMDFFKRGIIFYRQNKGSYRSRRKVHKRYPSPKKLLENTYKMFMNLAHNLA